MSYIKTIWQNDTTDVDATNMNHIEDGIETLDTSVSTLSGDLSNKVDKVSGKQLSTEDYTTNEKTKLANLENYTLPSSTQSTLGGIKIWVDNSGNLQISTQ